ncbi:hypothetical protein [Nocardia sp. CC227C]|uniref:hypothetical protein n=1 Tax=Nocardia sp. CC227C TaxID=3044562 RepID=UPI00278C4A3C|nr:hypothetical protein [Nocardia sp. CC227C]
MLTVTTTATTETFEAVTRFATDEANNLMVFAGNELVALYAAEQWVSVRKDPETASLQKEE